MTIDDSGIGGIIVVLLVMVTLALGTAHSVGREGPDAAARQVAGCPLSSVEWLDGKNGVAAIVACPDGKPRRLVVERPQ